MPTSNATCSDTLRHFQLVEAAFFQLLAFFQDAELLKQRPWLFRIRLERQMRLLHTLLLRNVGGFQRTDRLSIAMVQSAADNVKGVALKFDVAQNPPFSYIKWSSMLK